MGVRAAAVVLITVCGMATSAAETPAALAYDEALKHATDLGLPLVIEFGAEWCGPCKAFAATTLPDPSVQRALNDVVFVRYDADSPPGDAVTLKFHIDSFPTFVVVDKDGVERHRESGAPGVDAFLVLLAKAREVTVGEEALRQKVNETPGDAKARLALARWYLGHSRQPDALAELDAISKLRGAPAEIAADAKNIAARLRRIDRWQRELVAEKVAAIRADVASADEDDVIVATVGSPLPAADRRRVVHELLAGQTDDEKLNDMIYLALAAGEVDEALAAAESLVSRRRDAKHLDTLAECHHMKHDTKAAILAGREALGMAYSSPNEAPIRANLARFETGGEAREVKQKRLRSAELWKRIPEIDVLPERAVDPDYEIRMRAMRDGYVAQRKAQKNLSKAIEKACRPLAGASELVLVRLDLDGASHIKSMKVLVDTDAPKELRGCIEKQLEGAVIASSRNQKAASLYLTFQPPKGAKTAEAKAKATTPADDDDF